MTRVTIKKRGKFYCAKVQDGFATVRFTLKNWEYVKSLIQYVKFLSVTNEFLPPHCFNDIRITYKMFEITERAEYGLTGGCINEIYN